MNKRYIPFLMVFVFALSMVCFSQTNSENQVFEEVTIPGTERRHITSQIVNQKYDLLINLPGGYKESGEDYPVLVLLDAQWDFPLLAAIYGQQYYDGFVPEMIIVGITWGGEDNTPGYHRGRDFAPSKVEWMPQSGGAEKFLQFIKNELIPFLEKEYRVTDERVLMGSSLGGLFTLYAMFTDPVIFKHYVPTSPASGWDNDYLYDLADNFAEKSKGKSLRMFMAEGELENSLPGFKKLAAFFENRQFPGLTFQTRILDGIGHSGVKAEGNTRGLQFVFKRSSLVLSENILDKYTGTYQMQNSENTIKVLHKDNQLILEFPNSNHVTMLAETEKKFYKNGEFLKLEFQLSGDSISGFDLLRYGRKDFFEKIN